MAGDGPGVTNQKPAAITSPPASIPEKQNQMARTRSSQKRPALPDNVGAVKAAPREEFLAVVRALAKRRALADHAREVARLSENRAAD
jgi:hypothetical protein